MPVRVFESFDSYDKFLPLLYGSYSDDLWNSQNNFASLCYEQIDAASTSVASGGTDVIAILGSLTDDLDALLSDRICQELGFADAVEISEISDMNATGYRIVGDVFSADLTYFDETNANWKFGLSEFEDCLNHMSDVVVECTSNSAEVCLDHDDQCATDLDCCDLMFCSPITGTCVDTVECLS